MSRPVTAIRNLGPAYQKAFAGIGITTAEEVIALGADAAYGRLLAAGHRPHFIGYYVLVMGLQGRPWNDPSPEEKHALRQRFDALKATAATAGDSGATRARLEAVLNQIGVVPGPGDGPKSP